MKVPEDEPARAMQRSRSEKAKAGAAAEHATAFLAAFLARRVAGWEVQEHEEGEHAGNGGGAHEERQPHAVGVVKDLTPVAAEQRAHEAPEAQGGLHEGRRRDAETPILPGRGRPRVSSVRALNRPMARHLRVSPARGNR